MPPDTTRDEAAIRRWFDRWLHATREGDAELANRLVDDDAVLLVPGAGAMDEGTFVAAATAEDPTGTKDYALDCELEEIRVLGDHAWTRSRLRLDVTDKESGERTTMAGHALSILRRDGDDWLLVRDANTMVVVPDQATD